MAVADVRVSEQSSTADGDTIRVNREISVDEVRLIDEAGTNLGICKLETALRKAQQRNLDLVEVSPLSAPPVCRLLDFGRFKYREQKRRNEARKKQRNIEVKEIKLRPNIDPHDYDIKMRSVRRFLEDGDKVKLTIRFRGREMSRPERGREMLEKTQVLFESLARVEQEVSMEGRQMTLILVKKAKGE